MRCSNLDGVGVALCAFTDVSVDSDLTIFAVVKIAPDGDQQESSAEIPKGPAKRGDSSG